MGYKPSVTIFQGRLSLCSQLPFTYRKTAAAAWNAANILIVEEGETVIHYCRAVQIEKNTITRYRTRQEYNLAQYD
jgi:hypothetical protein